MNVPSEEGNRNSSASTQLHVHSDSYKTQKTVSVLVAIK